MFPLRRHSFVFLLLAMTLADAHGGGGIVKLFRQGRAYLAIGEGFTVKTNKILIIKASVVSGGKTVIILGGIKSSIPIMSDNKTWKGKNTKGEAASVTLSYVEGQTRIMWKAVASDKVEIHVFPAGKRKPKFN